MTNLKLRRLLTFSLILVLLAFISVNISGCSEQIKANDLMSGISPKSPEEKNPDEKFILNTADFSIELFKKTITEGKNSLISPLSVMLALSMTANGADNKTLEQMEGVLGKDFSIDELNSYLYSYVKGLPDTKKSRLDIANSIWFRDSESFTVQKDFLQKNADYYSASAYKSAFDGQTVKDINVWVKDKTKGMINKILDQINPDSVMILINAMAFEAEWNEVYNKNHVRNGIFKAIDGTEQKVDFMYSNENSYIENANATGFIKPYADGKYSFAALLPKEGVKIEDYISNLSGEEFINMIKEAKKITVSVTLPKFKYDYSIFMNDALSALGMPDAFSGNADFSRLGKSDSGNIFIGEVLHKTFIAVDELGTRAGAVTEVQMKAGAAMDPKIVKLDRPFIYAIIDNTTKLPVFIGTLMSIK